MNFKKLPELPKELPPQIYELKINKGSLDISMPMVTCEGTPFITFHKTLDLLCFYDPDRTGIENEIRDLFKGPYSIHFDIIFTINYESEERTVTATSPMWNGSGTFIAPEDSIKYEKFLEFVLMMLKRLVKIQDKKLNA